MYGLGLDLAAMCDLTPGAPIGERCYGFLGAIVEMALGSQQLREQGYDEASLLFVRTCIPPDLKMEEVVEAIRSHISPECTAICSESSYVLAALEAAYLCPEDAPAQ